MSELYRTFYKLQYQNKDKNYNEMKINVKK